MDKATTRQRRDGEDAEVMLGLLSAVEADETVTQRSLAGELGIALGLVNAYLKRCVKKGLIKVQEAPTRRYGYYLTPQGFAEKSRLTVDYLSHSFGFFRHARQSCADALDAANDRGWQRLVLIGASELAEVAALCALESPVEIVAIYDPGMTQDRFAGLDVIRDAARIESAADGAMLTAMNGAERWLVRATDVFGPERVIIPDLLGFVVGANSGAPELALADGQRR